jgi:hypothetical protein
MRSNLQAPFHELRSTSIRRCPSGSRTPVLFASRSV